MELIEQLSSGKLALLKDLFRLREGVQFWEGAIVSLGLALVTGLFAQIRIPIPFSPVPLTGQVFAVLLVGLVFGKSLGLGSQIAYAGLGALGLPWFSGLSGGLAVLAGPTGGYILGFIPGAYLVGLFSERFEPKNLWGTFLLCLGGLTVIYLFGLLQLSLFLNTGLKETISLGLFPFIGLDLAKVFLAALVFNELWPSS